MMQTNYQDIAAHVRGFQPAYADKARRLASLEISATNPLAAWFSDLRSLLLQGEKFGQLLARDPALASTPLAELEALNREFYAPLALDGAYDTCHGNPDFAVKQHGAELGGLLCAIYSQARSIRHCLLIGDYLVADLLLGLYFDLWAKARAGNLAYKDWLADYRAFTLAEFEPRVAFQMLQNYSPEAGYFRAVVETADLSDLRYLYRYGIHLSEHDLAMAQYINQYPAAELEAIAAFIVKSWVDGFVRARKDHTKKRHANLMIPLGMERLGRMVIAELDKTGIAALVPRPHSNGINRQFSYDHRFDRALTLDRETVDKSLETMAGVLEANKELIAAQAGPVYVELFGETPFAPEAKASALKLSPEQQILAREQGARSSEQYSRYYRRDEASFTIIAFPSPEIGPQFRQIFADTLRINLLDSQRYAVIQQKIIDVLDTADHVHVKGLPGNDTDIRVKMHPISDPATQTNFENCVADVNIPVGEVFTSPLLTGTNGILHVADIYLGNLRYFNLRITFEEGWVKDYSCTNFADPAESKKYIHENLLLPHDSLPIGEFAIGTNTLAYQIARKYDILPLLPILIIEKMGPHFAIGDTCFSHEEDAPHPSFVNGKEMIAVENEKSSTRKEDPVNAYTQKHMDITLPYEMLESITAIAADGSKTDIIRNGRFAVAGTEELNIPLDEGWETV